MQLPVTTASPAVHNLFLLALPALPTSLHKCRLIELTNQMQLLTFARELSWHGPGDLPPALIALAGASYQRIANAIQSSAEYLLSLHPPPASNNDATFCAKEHSVRQAAHFLLELNGCEALAKRM